MTRFLAYSMIALGFYFLGHAAYDEQRGIAQATSPGSRGGQTYIIKREDDPRGFRSLMTYEWVRGPVVLCAGLFILGLCRRADRLDPFSPHFAGNSALDELNQTLKKEEERRHNPNE